MVLKRRGRRSRTSVAALAAASALVLGPVLAGCGDDDVAGDPIATGTRSVPADAPSDPVAAKAEITKNWLLFFNPRTPADERVKLLENGEQLGPALEVLMTNDAASQATAKVKAIEFTSPNDADVTYDLLVAGSVAVPNAKGTSVLQDDTWKVSAKTLCGLAQLSGASVPGC
ncbi:hypothetical protein ACF09C_22365 [Streptomyces sp. NPDC014870]|uniref:hypothetical protein n=1 Tax=Streptomyces sp. NPDC014870 TaxID=3364925 RepID=UPI0036F88185